MLKFFYKTTKYRISMIVILAMLLQVFMPVMENYVYAEGNEVQESSESQVDEPSEVNNEGESGETVDDDDASIESAGNGDNTLAEPEEPKDEEISEIDSNELDGEDENEEDKPQEDVGEPTPDKSNPVDTITSVVMKDLKGNIIDENSQNPIEQGSAVSLFYTWEIKNDQEVNPGDYTIVHVPKEFNIYNSVEGDLTLSDGESAGKFYLSTNGELKLIFNDYPSKNSDVGGTVKFNTEFNKEVITGENPVTIKFPISETNENEIKVRFKPGGNTAPIAKYGRANKDLNPDRIIWTIDVNTELSTVEEALVTDTIGNGHSLDRETIQAYKLNVDIDGEVTQGNPITLGDGAIAETDTGFTVDLGKINTAYRIVYETTIDNDAQFDFENKASLGNSESPANVSVTKGSTIDKSGSPDKSFNPSTITWTIDVNKSLSKVSNGVVEDNLQAGLSLVEDSIKVYKLTMNEEGEFARAGEALSKDKDYTVEEIKGENNVITGFKVKFSGDIEDAYQIEYETNIEDKTKIEFENKAKFNGKEKTAKIDIKRGKLITKKGTPTIDYNEKYITWEIDVNTAEEVLTDVVVEDTFGPGLSLNKDSIKVYHLALDKNGNATQGTEVSSDKYTIEYDQNDSTKFQVKLLGEINSPYRIVYRTDITDNNKNNGNGFINKASIGGVGTGEIESNPDIKNEFKKEAIENGIDYSEKTMSWKITIDPKKEPIKDLIIEDTFPNGGLELMPETLEVKKGETKLNEGENEDYILEALENKENDDPDWTKGFKLKFKKDVEQFLYTITYETKFDPDSHSNIEEKLKYTNKASFTWNNLGEPLEKDAFYTIEYIASNNGNKNGTLTRDKKEITWNINLNYLSKPIGENLTVVDNIGEHQKLITDSMEVYTYTVKSDGSMILGGKVDNTDNAVYTIEEASEKGFKIMFKAPITSPYRIVFKTKLVGKSQDKYTNTATVGDIKYKATVGYEDSEKFVEKEGTQSGGNIKWKITVNKSLSDIEDATLIDTIGAGQELIRDSFKVYRASDEKELSKDKWKETVEDPDLATGTQTFKFKFLETINTMYIIEYETEITTEVDFDKLTNIVFFEGDGISTENEPFAKEIEVRVTTGSGEGWGKVGSIKIVKVDAADDIPLSGVEFKLYDSEGKLKGTGKTNDEGVLLVPGLKWGKYTLIETGPHSGYQILEANKNIEVTINSEDEQEVVVKNHKLRSLKIIKVDSKNEEIFLPGAVFEIKDSNDNLVATAITNSEGVAIVEGLPFDEYKIVEKEAPYRYKLDTTEHIITIDESDMEFELKLTNDRKPTRPLRPTDPTDPRDPKDPEEPTKPKEPIKPTDPTEPKDPERPVEPIDPEDPLIDIDGDTPGGGTSVDPKDPEDSLTEIGGGLPKGGKDVEPKEPTLPKTGENSKSIFYVSGLLLIILGFVFKRKIA